MTSNPRYLQKLGLMRNTIKIAAKTGENWNEEKFVDELSKILRDGCSIKEFIFYCK
jgi:hypothetical protein